MTWIKICGTTNLEDAQLAAEAGADALGFIFAPSARRITPTAAAEIIPILPSKVEKVGVFAERSDARARRIAASADLTGIQFQRGCTPDAFEQLKAKASALTVIHVLSIGDMARIAGFRLRKNGRRWIDRVMFDNGSGGTGRSFDWKQGREIVRIFSMEFGAPIIIAGGLTPDNVGEAIRLFRPWGVDVASGVESRPGKKDPQKLRAFIQAVREAEKSLP
ncbi:MAG TPA: phosphoribosylanthranilate isomerase [Terriglobales bacterium]|nr:phosphoribosylanthranilate isomerase [Terriglobales bacterium]